MEKQELIKELDQLTQWFRDPSNNSQHPEYTNNVNKRNHIKIQVRDLTRIENRADYAKRHLPLRDVEIVKVEEDFTEKNIDTYRYHSLLKRLNTKYVADNCKFTVGDLVKSECGKVGTIAEFVVHADEVKRKVTGIFAKLYQLKQDGTPSQKMLRRSRLDDKGFPIEILTPTTTPITTDPKS